MILSITSFFFQCIVPIGLGVLFFKMVSNMSNSEANINQEYLDELKNRKR